MILSHRIVLLVKVAISAFFSISGWNLREEKKNRDLFIEYFSKIRFVLGILVKRVNHIGGLSFLRVLRGWGFFCLDFW